MKHSFELAIELPVSAEAAYEWHTRPGAFERLLPPWESAHIVERRGGFESGSVVLEVALGPVRRRWVARHRDAVPGRQFVDEQAEGPFDSWVHIHRFDPLGPDRCRMTDHVDYQLSLGGLGELAAGVVAERLRRSFTYRHSLLAEDLAVTGRYSGTDLRTIAVTGATGLLGGALLPFLTTAGHRVRRVVRGQPGPDDVLWNPAAGRLDVAALEGVDAVVHLAGESIAGGRWNPERRRRILDSRTKGTSLLAENLARLRRPPKVLVSASAVGIYGDRGDEPLTEESPLRSGPSSSFVEQVGHAWEAAAEPAVHAGIRVVHARFGVVLSPAGGALAAMLPAFRAGIAGRLGSGRQVMSWIAIDDAIGGLYHALNTEALRGPVNLTAPAPATNAEFTTILGRVLSRPTIFPVPAPALRLALGEMANELLLAGARVLPARLQASGYRFRFAGLEPALRHVLGRVSA